MPLARLPTRWTGNWDGHLREFGVLGAKNACLKARRPVVVAHSMSSGIGRFHDAGLFKLAGLVGWGAECGA